MVSVAMKNTQLLQVCLFFFLKDGYAYLNAFFAKVTVTLNTLSVSTKLKFKLLVDCVFFL